MFQMTAHSLLDRGYGRRRTILRRPLPPAADYAWALSRRWSYAPTASGGAGALAIPLVALLAPGRLTCRRRPFPVSGGASGAISTAAPGGCTTYPQDYPPAVDSHATHVSREPGAGEASSASRTLFLLSGLSSDLSRRKKLNAPSARITSAIERP